MFIESIKINNGKICNIEYHIERVNNTLRGNYVFFKDFISTLTFPLNGTYKLRIVYDYTKIIEHSVTPYSPKIIKSLKLIECNTIDYNYKYANRQNLENLYAKKENADDIIIVKNNLLTDSSFSNLLFFDGKEWITPAQPLLKGTCRERLIKTGIVKIDNIYVNQLSRYKSLMLVNAMLDFDKKRVIDLKNVF